ncbi:MAG: tetratricopeptide repeat protein, partial [Pseudomonadota bacterium]
MLEDRYGNALSTASVAARDAYVAGTDLFLSSCFGVEEAMARAISEDPNFALAHIVLARQHQSMGRPAEIAAHLAAARGAKGLTAREAAHVDALATLCEGRGPEAYGKIRAHLAEHPRDAMVAQTCVGVFGLIGFSGQR